MVTNFSDLRKQNKNFSALKERMKKEAGGKKDYTDDRFWQAQLDKAGNAEAVIRFLPAPQGEELPHTPALYKHTFKGKNGQWIFENCPTTIDKECPICEMNGKLWNSGLDSDKEIVQGKGREKPGTKRVLSYIANVYVVSDPANPENEGKVFLFKFGKLLYDKLLDAVDPKFKSAQDFDPFDLWEGANFNLRIYKKDGYSRFDQCSFDAPAPLMDDDKELEKVWKSQHSLNEFSSEDNFKDYKVLETRLNAVMGNKMRPVSDNVEDDMPSVEEKEDTRSVAEEEQPSVNEDIDMDALEDEDSEEWKKLEEMIEED